MATRAELRRIIGGLLNDVTELTATTAGSTNTFVDTVTLASNIEHPNNRDIVFFDGNNAGVVRRVTNADLLAGWVSFDALPDATDVDHTAEMYNFRGKGFRVVEYNRMINQALRIASDGLWKNPQTVSVQSAEVFADTNEISLTGSNLTAVYAVEYLVGSETYTSIPAASGANRHGWWTDGEDSITVNGFQAYINAADDDDFVVRGFGPAVLFDDDSTDLPTPASEWITNQVASMLCLSALDRDQGNFARAQAFGRIADQALPSIRTRIPGSTRRVDGS